MPPKPYDPLPDIAESLTALFTLPAHEMTGAVHKSFGRLIDTMKLNPAKVGVPSAAAVEAGLRVLLGRFPLTVEEEGRPAAFFDDHDLAVIDRCEEEGGAHAN
jgi:hypothetical protein